MADSPTRLEGPEAPDQQIVVSERQWKIPLVAGVFLMICLAMGFMFFHPTSQPEKPSHDAGQSERTFTVKPQPLTFSVSITGKIEAGTTTPIVAPFDGSIQEIKIPFGGVVKSGDIIATIDKSKIEAQYRDAQIEFLRMTSEAESLINWKESPEVLRSKWTLDSARRTLASQEREVAELKQLFDRGIISRNEYDTAVKTRDDQIVSVEQAQQDYLITLKKGDEENMEVSRLKLENAQSTLYRVYEQLAGQVIKAPHDGILVRIQDNSSQKNTLIDVGARVSTGDPIFAVARTDTYKFTGSVSEIDMLYIQPGQVARIKADAIPGFAVDAKIISISAEAASKSSDNLPTFDVQAVFDRPEGRLGEQLRLGITAKMTIDVENRKDALVIPISAVLTPQDSPTVLVSKPGGVIEERRVELGRTTLDGIEVIQGILKDEIILLQ